MFNNKPSGDGLPTSWIKWRRLFGYAYQRYSEAYQNKKKAKNGGKNVGNLGTNYAKKPASLKEMVNDKIELNFGSVKTATNDLIPILTKL